MTRVTLCDRCAMRPWGAGGSTVACVPLPWAHPARVAYEGGRRPHEVCPWYRRKESK